MSRTHRIITSSNGIKYTPQESYRFEGEEQTYRDIANPYISAGALRDRTLRAAVAELMVQILDPSAAAMSETPEEVLASFNDAAGKVRKEIQKFCTPTKKAKSV